MADDLQEINVDFVDGKLVFRDPKPQNGDGQEGADNDDERSEDDSSSDSQEDDDSPEDDSPEDDEEEVSINWCPCKVCSKASKARFQGEWPSTARVKKTLLHLCLAIRTIGCHMGTVSK